MRISKSLRMRTTRRFAAPRLEQLDQRCLLSGKAVSTVIFSQSPGTSFLTITDTIKNDSLSINDNGTGAAGNIYVSSGGGQTYMSTAGVSLIMVRTGKGSDHVTYELDGNLQPNVDQTLIVGSELKKGGGSLALTVNVVGTLLANSDLTVNANPLGTKTTTMTVNDSGEIDGTLSTNLMANASTNTSHSPEVFNFQSTAAIASNGKIAAQMWGSTKNDMGSVTYSGTNDGNIFINEVGGNANNQLTANVYMAPGSTGMVGGPSFVYSSGKKDKLAFTIYQGTDSAAASDIIAYLEDRSKKDVALHTANVTAITKGSDTLVS
jgi:hypothetical protein